MGPGCWCNKIWYLPTLIGRQSWMRCVPKFEFMFSSQYCTRWIMAGRKKMLNSPPWIKNQSFSRGFHHSWRKLFGLPTTTPQNIIGLYKSSKSKRVSSTVTLASMRNQNHKRFRLERRCTMLGVVMCQILKTLKEWNQLYPFRFSKDETEHWKTRKLKNIQQQLSRTGKKASQFRVDQLCRRFHRGRIST